MEKDLTLLVMAAGMGSRFGGLKQIEPVGPNGEFIIDYSIKDAIIAGFTKVVFVIKEENYQIFKETIGARVEDKIKVEYVFQKTSDVPEGIVIPSDRVKPLGTAQAIYCTRNVIKENFATINADDFYGRDAYIKAAEFLKNCKEDEYAIVGYEVGNTLTENGSVKRGVIFGDDNKMKSMVESSIYEKNGMAYATPLEGGEEFTIPLNQPVSMNLFCLTPKFFEFLETDIVDFFTNRVGDLNTGEYLLPNAVFDNSRVLDKPVSVTMTDSKYLGMTYREDLEELKKGILKEIEKGTYSNNLWG